MIATASFSRPSLTRTTAAQSTGLRSRADGWADSLNYDSIFEIDRLAQTLNEPRVPRFIKRQQEVLSNISTMAKLATV